MLTVGLVDKTQRYKPGSSLLLLMAKALERQARYHYAPIWGYPAEVVVGQEADQLIYLFDSPESAGYLGWHDVDPNGNPYAHVYAEPSFSHGSSWVAGKWPISETISHELLEMLGDPYCNSYGYDGKGDRLWCMEMCDAVQNSSYLINVTGGSVPVSNFVTPDFFNAYGLQGRRWDYKHVLPGPFTIMQGGYSIVAELSDETTIDGKTKVYFGPELPDWERALKVSPGSRTSWRRLFSP